MCVGVGCVCMCNMHSVCVCVIVCMMNKCVRSVCDLSYNKHIPECIYITRLCRLNRLNKFNDKYEIEKERESEREICQVDLF